MVKYNYDILISHKIIESVDGKEDGINAYKLNNAVRDSCSNQSPSDSKIFATRQQLENWHILEKRKGEKGKDMFHLSELWKILSSFKFEPHDLPMFIRKVHTICVGALGLPQNVERTGPPQLGDICTGLGLIVDDLDQIDLEQTKFVTRYLELGISKEDLINKRNFVDNIQYPDFSSYEIDKYFDFLCDQGMIIPSHIRKGSTRYVLSPEVRDFYTNCYIPLNVAVIQRFFILVSSPKTLREEDKVWYKLHHGQRKYDAIFKSRKLEKSFENKYRIKNGITDTEAYQIEKKIKESRKRRLEKANEYLILIHDLIMKKYEDKVIGIPGLKELLISLVCPTNILDTVKKDLYAK